MLGREPRAAQGPRKLFGRKRRISTTSRKLKPWRVSHFPLAPSSNPARSTGHKARPQGAGRKTQGGRENGNDEDPARGVRREQLPEPQGPGRRLGARAQHRGERADHPAHRGGGRRGLPARRRPQAHRGHEVARDGGGRRLRDGRLGRRANRADPQRREQPPQGADRGRARARHPDDALVGSADRGRSRIGRHPRGEGRVLRARHQGGARGRDEPGLRRGGAHGRLRRRAHRGRRGGRALEEEPLGPPGHLPQGARSQGRRGRGGPFGIPRHQGGGAQVARRRLSRLRRPMRP